jgi:copper chaperone CopZ
MVNFRPAILAFALSAAALAADQSVTLKVDGWHSKGDAYKTEQAVRQVKGVRSASADAGKKELTVVFDDAVASEAWVRKAISEAGYNGHR